MLMPNYVRYPNCKVIELDERYSYSDLSVPCPHCGFGRQLCATWPQAGALLLLRWIDEFDLSVVHDRWIAIVLMSVTVVTPNNWTTMIVQVELVQERGARCHSQNAEYLPPSLRPRLCLRS